VVSGGDASNYVLSHINGTLTIQDKVVPPVITAPPDPVFARAGDNVIFNVETRGVSIAYQWFKGGKAIAGANANLLRLYDVSDDDVGVYTVEVSNEAGKVVSFPAFLKIVIKPPFISEEPSRFDLVFTPGETIILDPKIKTEGPTTFQWDKDGKDLPGETDPILIIHDVKDDDAGNYTVDATNLAGTTTSETMRVSVVDEAKIGQHVINNFRPYTGIIDSSPAIGQDGSVYYSIVGESVGYLYRHEPNGVRKWGLRFNSALRGSPAIDHNGVVYVLEDAGALHAVTEKNGKGEIAWSYKLTGEEVDATGEVLEHGNSPAITEDGTIIFGWFDSNVYAVKEGEQPKQGELVWEFPFSTEGRVVSSPSIAPDGTIYIGTEAGFLYAINPDDGTPVWTKPFETGDKIMTRPAIDTEGNIYFGSFSGEFYALDSNGTPKWKFDTEQSIWTSAVIRADGTVYFGADDGFFYALDTETGDEKWRYEIKNNFQMSASAVLGLDGSIYFTLFNNTFYAINRIGEELWTVKLKGDGEDLATYSSPSLLDDGKIYVGTKDGEDGLINVIQGGSPIDIDSPWPSFGGDMQNTGRVMVKRTDAESFKAELRVTEVGGGSLTIQVTGDAFETYTLQYTNDLKGWKVVPDLQSIQTNFRGKANIKRTIEAGSAPTFYRLLNE
jgi:outer membrane protein assembly factor BamB